MSTKIDTVLNITANVSGQGAVEAMRTGVGHIATAFDRVKMAQDSVVSGLRGLAALATGGMFASMIKGAIDLGASLNDVSEKTGVSAVALAKWNSVAKSNGGDLGTVEMGFKKLSKTMFDALTGNEKSITAFKALGLSVETLKNKNPNEVMLEIAEAVSEMPDGLIKAGVLFQIFGKEAAELIPILNQGREAIDGVNTAITDEFAKNADAFDKNIIKLKGSFSGLTTEAAAGLLPALIDITSSFTVISGMTGVKSFFETLGEVVRVAQFAFMGLANTIGLVKDAIIWLGEMGGAKAGGMGWSDAFSFANDSLAAKTQNRAASFMQGYSNLSSHSSLFQSINSTFGVDLPEPTGARAGKNRDSSRTQAALAVLRDARDKPDRDAEEKAYQTRMAKLKAANEEQNTALSEELSLVGKTAAAIENLKDKRETERKIKEQIIGLSPAHQAAYRKEAEAAEQARESLRLFNEQQKRTFEYGMAEWSAKYQDDVSNTAKNTQTIMQKSFDGISDGLTKLVTGGKTSFSELTQSIIADIIKMQIESSIMGPLAKALGGTASAGAAGASSGGFADFIRSIFGFASGGVMTSYGPVPLRRYAGGGIANSPQLAMFGEGDSAEAYVPLPDGRSIPVALSGRSGGGDTHVGVTVNMGDGSVTATSRGDQEGQMQNLGGMIANAVKGVLINERRPGGMLSASATGG